MLLNSSFSSSSSKLHSQIDDRATNEIDVLNYIRGVRPFGVSLLVAGYDESKGHSLYQVDPSGSYYPWKATAIGKNQVNAKTFLEKRCVYIE
jgi:20S proteasome alpha/beta subunit